MNIKDLKPTTIWQNFTALNTIPRPSKKEEQVVNFIKDFGNSLGLETIVDDVGNVLIKKPATIGMESRKTVILQAHLDMVCQKNTDTDFNFDEDGINMFVEDGWVKAKGTTLGADNGLGAAAIMSILQSKDISHPTIEALFTVDEETGMTGAFGLKPNFLSGDILLNLDTEEDDEIDIGCAGGVDVTATKIYPTEKITNENYFLIKVNGLMGGHSGVDIHKEHGNANIILGRLLYTGLDFSIRLISIDGGSLRNAIPREATAIISIKDPSNFLIKFNGIKSEILEEYRSLETNLNIQITEIKQNSSEPHSTNTAINQTNSKEVILVLNSLFNGVFRMSPDVAGLVEASNNVARVVLNEGHFEIQNLSRSSVESTKIAVARQLESVYKLASMDVKLSGSYPGWKPKPDSDIVKIMADIYEKKFNSKPRVVACHAGLECGIIGSNYPELDMVSFGPTIKGAHSPDEKVNIKSVEKFWEFLKEILCNIPEKQ